MNGFTLIEIVIAMAIMAFLSVMTAQSIQRAVQSKNRIQGNIERTSSLRDALRVMERDIQMAFHFRDIQVEVYNKAADIYEKERKSKTPQPTTPPAPGQPTTPPTPTTPPAPTTQPGAPQAPIKRKEQKLKTHFLGEENRLNFVSLSHIRTQAEAKVSNQAEIGYEMKSCRGRITKETYSGCLFRRVSTLIDDRQDEGGDEQVLLENIRLLEFRYLGQGPDSEWVTQWMTNEQGDDRTRNTFPAAVEITMEVIDKKDPTKSVRMTIVAAIRNPNNINEAPQATSAPGQPPQPIPPGPPQGGGP